MLRKAMLETPAIGAITSALGIFTSRICQLVFLECCNESFKLTQFLLTEMIAFIAEITGDLTAVIFLDHRLTFFLGKRGQHPLHRRLGTVTLEADLLGRED